MQAVVNGVVIDYSLASGRYAMPIPVPEELTIRNAKEAFDHGSRIFIVPRGKGLSPDDQFDASKQAWSFDWNDWDRNIDPGVVAALSAPHRLWAVWHVICEYAKKQPFVNQKPGYSCLDFYAFVRAEVRRCEQVPPVPDKPFESYFSSRDGRWSFNWYAPLTTPKKKKKKGKKT